MVTETPSSSYEKKKVSKDSVGKSPIDSLFGLVESIDSSIGVSKISPNQHNQKKAEQPLLEKMKTDGQPTITRTVLPINSKRVETTTKKLDNSITVKNEDEKVVERVRATKRPNEALEEDVEDEDSDNDMESSRKLVRVDTPSIVKSIQEKKEKSISPSAPAAIKPLMTNQTPDDKKKRRRKKLTYHPKHQRRMLKIAAENNKALITAEKIVKVDAIPIVKIEKTTSTTATTTTTKKIQRKPVTKQKRVDPIALALKNIKNRENTRRRQRLSMNTRRALSTSPNDLLRKAEQKPLKRVLLKKKKAKTKNSKESSNESDDKDINTEPEKPDTKTNEEEEENEDENNSINQRKKEKVLLSRSVTRSVAAKITQAQTVGVSTRNRANRRPIEPSKKLRILKVVNKKKTENSSQESEAESASQSKIKSPEMSSGSNKNNKASTIDIDLTCHEKVDTSSISPLGDAHSLQVCLLYTSPSPRDS